MIWNKSNQTEGNHSAIELDFVTLSIELLFSCLVEICLGVTESWGFLLSFSVEVSFVCHIHKFTIAVIDQLNKCIFRTFTGCSMEKHDFHQVANRCLMIHTNVRLYTWKLCNLTLNLWEDLSLPNLCCQQISNDRINFIKSNEIVHHEFICWSKSISMCLYIQSINCFMLFEPLLWSKFFQVNHVKVIDKVFCLIWCEEVVNWYACHFVYFYSRIFKYLNYKKLVFSSSRKF